MNEEIITSKEIELLDKLFNVWEREPIREDEDLIALGEIFDEEE